MMAHLRDGRDGGRETGGGRCGSDVERLWDGVEGNAGNWGGGLCGGLKA